MTKICWNQNQIQIILQNIRVRDLLYRHKYNNFPLVVGDVPVDSEAPVVISSISRICRLSLSDVLIGVGLHACIHRGVSVYAFVSIGTHHRRHLPPLPNVNAKKD